MPELKNVTITLEEETARWARIEAAKRETSVSRLVGEMLRQHMDRERRYEAAKRDYLGVESRPLKRGGGYPARDSRHER